MPTILAYSLRAISAIRGRLRPERLWTFEKERANGKRLADPNANWKRVANPVSNSTTSPNNRTAAPSVHFPGQRFLSEGARCALVVAGGVFKPGPFSRHRNSKLTTELQPN